MIWVRVRVDLDFATPKFPPAYFLDVDVTITCNQWELKLHKIFPQKI